MEVHDLFDICVICSSVALGQFNVYNTRKIEPRMPINEFGLYFVGIESHWKCFKQDSGMISIL